MLPYNIKFNVPTYSSIFVNVRINILVITVFTMIVKILGFTRYFHICTTTHHFRSLQCCQWLSSHLKISYYPHCWWYWLKSFLLWNFTEPRNTNTYTWKWYYKHTLLYKAKCAKHNFEIMYIYETKETCASLC